MQPCDGPQARPPMPGRQRGCIASVQVPSDQTSPCPQWAWGFPPGNPTPPIGCPNASPIGCTPKGVPVPHPRSPKVEPPVALGAQGPPGSWLIYAVSVFHFLCVLLVLWGGRDGGLQPVVGVLLPALRGCCHPTSPLLVWTVRSLLFPTSPSEGSLLLSLLPAPSWLGTC